jgi:hypothetical protein
MCSEHYSRVTLKPQAVALMDGSRSSGHSFSQQRPPRGARSRSDALHPRRAPDFLGAREFSAK